MTQHHPDIQPGLRAHQGTSRLQAGRQGHRGPPQGARTSTHCAAATQVPGFPGRVRPDVAIGGPVWTNQATADGALFVVFGPSSGSTDLGVADVIWAGSLDWGIPSIIGRFRRLPSKLNTVP